MGGRDVFAVARNFGRKRKQALKAKDSLQQIREVQQLVQDALTDEQLPEQQDALLNRFLGLLEGLQTHLQTPKASREYRDSFSRNYAQIFPDRERRYRADVMRAALEKKAPLFVNGSQFDWPAACMADAVALSLTWERLLQHTNSVEAVAPELVTFDEQFATFEHSYIRFLIATEQACKELVREGHALCSQPFTPETEALFVAVLQQLNGLANPVGKGRTDLGVEILHAARATGSLSRLRSRVTSALEEAASYFRLVSLERVDPHLAKNARLVQVLSEWEDAWEAGMRYLLPKQVCQSMEELLCDLREVSRELPRFGEQLATADAEVCVLVPQMVACYSSMQQNLGLGLPETTSLPPLPDTLSYRETLVAIARGDEQRYRESGFAVMRTDPRAWNQFFSALSNELE